VLIALRNMIIELGILALVWILGILLGFIFPPIMLIYAPASAIFLFIVGGYFYGFSTMDYTNERRRMKVGESINFIRTNKGIAISNGMIFSLWLFIPILGPIIAPITCSCGATLAIADKIDLAESKFALKKTPKINQE
jgi:CysZ protein